MTPTLISALTLAGFTVLAIIALAIDEPTDRKEKEWKKNR